jgi:hypothetical protein
MRGTDTRAVKAGVRTRATLGALGGEALVGGELAVAAGDGGGGDAGALEGSDAGVSDLDFLPGAFGSDDRRLDPSQTASSRACGVLGGAMETLFSAPPPSRATTCHPEAVLTSSTCGPPSG